MYIHIYIYSLIYTYYICTYSILTIIISSSMIIIIVKTCWPG